MQNSIGESSGVRQDENAGVETLFSRLHRLFFPSNFIRVVFKDVLRFLTRWAVRKHRIKTIAILGERHSRLTAYLLWEILRTKYPTRCQWDRSYWDLAIPLSILGYEVRRYSLWGWILVVIRSFFNLTFRRARSQIIVLHIPSSLPEIVDYWLQCSKPELIVYFKGELDKPFIQKIRRKTCGSCRFMKVDCLPAKKFKKNYKMLGVFWNCPISATLKVARMHNIPEKSVFAVLEYVEPISFLKIFREIAKNP